VPFGSHPNNLFKEINNYPEISHLKDLFDSGGAEFHLTGLSLDLFRLRPEILSTIIIHDTEWSKQHFAEHKVLGNWEIKEDGVLAINLSEHNFFKVLDGEVGLLCAPGAACFVKGYQKFLETLQNRG
jgi:hypothetical protein